VNFGGRVLNKLGIQRPIFTPEALRKVAERKSGHSDYGSGSYMTGLEALLYSIEHEAQLHQLGRIVLFKQIVEGLANRLRVVAWEKANPELAAVPINPPLIIMGLPRSGTTILQETLAAAPGMRTPITWEITDYSLVHKVTDARSDKRVQKIDANIARLDQMAPGFRAQHYRDAYIPSECIGLTILDMFSEQFSALAWAPTYREFMLSCDHRIVYQWHRRGLRYLQANTPGVRWVLKAPGHAAYLGAVLETYPDAMPIHCHRNPVEVIGSNCSLYATLRRAWSDNVRLEEQAALDAAYAAKRFQWAVDYRRDHPDVDARICDVAFKDFMTDPAGTIARIYDHFGLELTDEARDAMLGYLENRPQHKYGVHRYSLDQFGLTAEGVASLFEGYNQRFAEFL